MLRKLYCILALIFLFIGAKAQVWNGNYNITSQEEVDRFAEDCNCTEITGSLTIEKTYYSTDIQHLDGLSGLTTVKGDLKLINNPALKNLSGLSNLKTVGGNLEIANNTELEDLVGLNSLLDVKESISISYNQ